MTIQTDNCTDSTAPSTARAFIRIGLCTALVSILMLGMMMPAAAQTASNATGNSTGSGFSGNPVCSMPHVTPLIQTGFDIFVWGALILGFFTWIATSMTESLPIPRDMKKSVKRHRNGAAMSAGRAVFIPGIALAVLGEAGIGIPSCFSIIPFTAILV